MKENQVDRLTEEKPIYSISFKKVDGYLITEQKALQKQLKRLKLYGRQFLYSSFPPNKLNLVIEKGTARAESPDPDIVFCCQADPLGNLGIYHPEGHDLISYLIQHAEGFSFATFAVYDRNKFDEEFGGHKFKEPDKKIEALLAVVRINDFWP